MHKLSSLLLVFISIWSTTILSCQVIKDESAVIGYGDASYSNLSDNIFLRNWLVIGPFEITMPEDKSTDDPAFLSAFDKDLISSVTFNDSNQVEGLNFNNKSFIWKIYKSDQDIVDLINFYGEKEYVISYALSEIKSDKEQTLLFGVGSDDGIKIWVNGKQVHTNFALRPVNIDDDIVQIPLKKGSNQILIKIQNGAGGYGFSLRPLGNDILADLLVKSSGNGDLDNVKLLIDRGIDPDSKNNFGLTAWQIAKIKGRTEIADYLQKNKADTLKPFPKTKDFLDSYYSELSLEKNTPGAAVLIAKNGEIIFEKGYGYAYREEKIKFTPQTKHRIGSVSKQFIASAILRMQEKGLISVEDKLSKYIPEFPRGDEVTIHHLLTHTSGIHSFTNRPEFIDEVINYTTTDEVLQIIKSEDYDFDPGEDYLYNNSGYFILGYLIEKISGQSLEEYLKEQFFVPLGMNNTGVYVNEKKPENDDTGYTEENGEYKKAIDWNMSWAGGAGSLYSTVEDLYTWNEALFHGKVLNDESMKQAFTPVQLNNGEMPLQGAYGYGWSLIPYRGLDIISHGGGLHGYLTYLMRYPADSLTIVTFINQTPPPAMLNPGAAAYNILEYLEWKNMDQQKSYSSAITTTDEELNKFAGKYDYGMGMVLTVTVVNGHIYAQMTNQPRFEIFPMGNDTFFWKVVEARIEFLRDENNKVIGGKHFQGGQEIKVKKLPD